MSATESRTTIDRSIPLNTVRSGRHGLKRIATCAAVLVAWSAGGFLFAADAPPRDFRPAGRLIDQEILQRLEVAKIKPAGRADDAEFLRRVCLDITGRIPTAERAAAFLDSNDPDKRRKLIDELLDNPLYGQHFATLWTNRIRANGTPPVSMRTSFTEWLTGEFNKGRGWDKIVAQMLIAEGTPKDSPASYFVRANLGEPGLLADTTGQFFLGVRLTCAECHGHPFAEWKQTDYWGLAVFFTRLRQVRVSGGQQVTEEPAPGKKLKTGADALSLVIPNTGGNKGAGKVVPARFLDSPASDLPEAGALRPALAKWVTSPKNPYFARAAVNRTWAHFFGTGFVNPVDDLRADNVPSHPDLLSRLAGEFIASGCDSKHLIRCLCNSEAYQRTSRMPANTKDEPALFGRMAVKVMSPDAMYDSLVAAQGVTQLGGGLGSPIPYEVYSGGAARPVRGPPREEFLKFFTTKDDSSPATDYTHGIPQALALMNAKQFNTVAPTVEKLVKSGVSREKVVETLFLATLTRRPTARETKLMSDYLAKRDDAKTGYAGVLWILFNSSEFILNQ